METTKSPSYIHSGFDEMYGFDGRAARPQYAEVVRQLTSLPAEQLVNKQRDAELLFRRMGITFAVYGANSSEERLIPFDVVPRVFSATEWRRLELGLKQRVRALNMFLHDIYHEQECQTASKIDHPTASNFDQGIRLISCAV
ncbi:circularly permuted type 2 ATP-grasp protein [Halothiobacillus sp.]|uniref:circularly permuted type 2 ATP-grasp protein n=1 Tax=Halothiobacillus sp. TaxID=1891311 RepID=UPI002605A633|nr:circularly permuted type 2 ATP-grasp protein [Halothiobacillus sp.]MDD4967573.1 circularly permuted type 2 ATP-grasp protein [Halothiobacillus sp.]